MLAKRDGLVEARMLVSVEYRPYLVGFFERIPLAPAVSSESFRPGTLASPLGDGVGNTCRRDDLHVDERTEKSTFDRIEVCRFCILPFAE